MAIVIVTVASYKGGVGKSTTAMHLAAYLQAKAPTLLVDGDPNRSVSAWAKRGAGFPYRVVDERSAVRHASQYQHIVIDTQARPNREDLMALVEGCDLLVVPSTPDVLALDALMLTATALKELGAEHFRVLFTIVPPRPSRDADEARALLVESGMPLFGGEIRRAVAFQKAALRGVLVSEVRDDRAAEAWGDYCHVGAEILP